MPSVGAGGRPSPVTTALRKVKQTSTFTNIGDGKACDKYLRLGACAQVVLNDIHIDIMDYIAPATCADVQFRSMWAEFEWENKARSTTCCSVYRSTKLMHACL